ncbi:MAG: hypothetical protein ACTHMG_03150 [Sphingomonas sp.]
MPRLKTGAFSRIALGGALLLAGCGGQSADGNNATQNTAMANNLAVDNLAGTNGGDSGTALGNGSVVVEDESSAPAVEIVTVPSPAPAASSSVAAPLTAAATAEKEISSGTGITRVRQPDGWAWMRNGRIIRTASTDGHRVAYFHEGAASPYLVQQDGRAYAYSDGKITREYDDRGRASAPTTQHRREAQQLAQDADHHRAAAEQVGRTASRTTDRRQTGANGQAADSQNRDSRDSRSGSGGGDQRRTRQPGTSQDPSGTSGRDGYGTNGTGGASPSDTRDGSRRDYRTRTEAAAAH